MTDNPKKILQEMWNKRVFGDPNVRHRILDEPNASALDDVGPVGGDTGEKFLKEPNQMQDLGGEVGRKENPDR